MLRKSFADQALQQEYEAGLATEKIRLTRIAIGLATLINVSFVALDVWAIPSALATVWGIRIAMNVILLACLATTWHADFQRWYAGITATVFLTLGSGINAMIYVAAPSDLAIDAYYGGLMLTTFGLYTLTHVKLTVSVAVSAVLLLSYTAISVLVHDFLRADKVIVLVANLFFFVAAMVLGFVAQGVRDRYSRENYLLRHALERDVEMHKEEKVRASYLAEHDALTGLANRLSFDRQAEAMLETGRRHDLTTAVLFIDLDKFKPVNDAYGHEAGDEVLKVIAGRLREGLRKSDLVARFGGDEFVACLHIKGDVAPVLKKLKDLVVQPIALPQAEVEVAASIGAAVLGQDGNTLEALLRHADEDMYARKHGRHLAVAAANSS